MVYGQNNDANIKHAVKNNVPLNEFFDRPEIKDTMDKLSEATHTFFGTEAPKQRMAPADVACEAEAHGVATGFAMSRELVESMANYESQPEGIKDVIERRLKLVEQINALADDGKEDLKTLEKDAKQKVADYVQLVVESGSATSLSKLIADSYVGSLRGDGDGLEQVLIFYDNKLAGEAQTTPHLRMPSMKTERVKKCITAVNLTRDGGQDSLDAGDLFLFFDGGVTGNRTVMLNQMQNSEGKPLNKSVFNLYLHYSEDAIESKYSKLKDSSNLNQLEGIMVVTSGGAQQSSRFIGPAQWSRRFSPPDRLGLLDFLEQTLRPHPPPWGPKSTRDRWD